MQRLYTKIKAYGFHRCMICLCVLMIAASLAGFFLWSTARSSARLLLNRVFDASEAVNSYVYERFTVPEGTETVTAQALLMIIALCLAGLCIMMRGGLLPVLLAVLLACGQAYLGLSLPPFVNVGCFGMLAVAVVGKRAGKRAALTMTVSMVVISLIVALWLPGTNAAVEAASEHVRDLLGAMPEQEMPASGEQLIPVMETRHENRRDLTDGAESALPGQDYQLVTVDEQQITRPHWIDIVRIVMLCLLIPVALVLPFAPFWWMNSRVKKAVGKYACMDASEPEIAINGMFALVIEYLDACRIGDPHALYSHRLDEAVERLPRTYCTMYAECVAVWQETVYSDHPVEQAWCEQVAALLEETEKLFYEQADRKTKLRLKYICCLHG